MGIEASESRPDGGRQSGGAEFELPEAYRGRLDELKESLRRVVALAESSETPTPAALAKTLLAEADGLFLTLVVGEVKSGKSAFLNALLGGDYCPEGPTPLTDKIHVLRYADEPSESLLDEHLLDRRVPVPLLRRIRLVDTPGTNSLVKRHQEITEAFVPRADLVFFVTSVDRPLSESEFRFLSFVESDWRRKVVFALTKIDTREPHEVEAVRRYVASTVERELRMTPEIFPVSARQALRARASGDAAALEKSGIPAVERYIRERLLRGEAVRLKLLGPLDAASKLVAEMASTVRSRRESIEADFAGATRFREQIEASRPSLRDRLGRMVRALHEELAELRRRGDAFLVENVRLTKLQLLRSRERFRDAFTEAVLIDMSPRVEAVVRDAADRLVGDLVALRERAVAFLAGQAPLREQYGAALAGGGVAPFEPRRSAVAEAVRNTIDRDLSRLKAAPESERLLGEMRRGLARFFGVEALSIGLGAGLVILFHSILLDATGVVMALVLSISGFAILPAYRNRARAAFAERVSALESELVANALKAFEGEIDREVDGLVHAFEPFRSFHDSERKRHAEAEEAIDRLRRDLIDLRHRVETAPPAGA